MRSLRGLRSLALTQAAFFSTLPKGTKRGNEETMNTDAVFSYSRIIAIEEFRQALGRAQTGFRFRWLSAKANALEDFRSLMPFLHPNRRYLGTIEVPVEQIVGSIDRGADFDRSFRPLGSHLRDRWVSVYLLAKESDWPPIRLFKAGGRYFVEDGHNRVSVARTLGMPAIRAEVWEYPLKPVGKDDPCCGRTYCDLPLAEG
jgi:hypothetical protein